MLKTLGIEIDRSDQYSAPDKSSSIEQVYYSLPEIKRISAIKKNLASKTVKEDQNYQSIKNIYEFMHSYIKILFEKQNTINHEEILSKEFKNPTFLYQKQNTSDVDTIVNKIHLNKQSIGESIDLAISRSTPDFVYFLVEKSKNQINSLFNEILSTDQIFQKISKLDYRSKIFVMEQIFSINDHQDMFINSTTDTKEDLTSINNIIPIKDIAKTILCIDNAKQDQKQTIEKATDQMITIIGKAHLCAEHYKKYCNSAKLPGFIDTITKIENEEIPTIYNTFAYMVEKKIRNLASMEKSLYIGRNTAKEQEKRHKETIGKMLSTKNAQKMIKIQQQRSLTIKCLGFIALICSAAA